MSFDKWSDKESDAVASVGIKDKPSNLLGIALLCTRGDDVISDETLLMMSRRLYGSGVHFEGLSRGFEGADARWD